MDKKLSLAKTFFRPIIRSLLIVIVGFLLSPTHLLLSIYQENAAIRGIAIIVGMLITIFGLFNMLSVSLKAISDYTEKSFHDEN